MYLVELIGVAIWFIVSFFIVIWAVIIPIKNKRFGSFKKTERFFNKNLTK